MRRRERRGAGSATAAILGLLLALAAIALLGPAGAAGAPRPGESCPDQTPPPGQTEVVCNDTTGPDVNGGPGGLDMGLVLPIAGVVVGGGLLAMAAWYLTLRRRAAVPFAPAEPGEWWTCPTCSKQNVIGSPRCYACGTWRP